jgi:hypothetical protein
MDIFGYKYTNKIKKFFNTHLNDELTNLLNEHNYDDNEIIIKFINIFKNQTNIDIELIKSVKIDKMHNYSNIPLLYLILFKKLGKTEKYKKYFINDKIFYKWIRENLHTLDMNDEMFDEYKDVLFNLNENRKELHLVLYDNLFVSIDVLHHAESEDLQYSVYKNNITEIHTYVPINSEEPNVQIILRIIDFYRTLFNKQTKHVKLVVFYGDQKKYICEEHNESICSDNVNSGLSIQGFVIRIWRKEEFYKVLIHELVHYFGVDFYISDDIYKKINKYFKSFIKIKGIDRVNESYTEIMANVIHNCLCSVLFNKSFTELFVHELLFSHLQTCKLLNHFEYETYEQFILNKNENLISTENKKTTINQTTSACSYYIIKCIFMVHLNNFLNFWKLNGFVIKSSKNTEQNYLTLYKNIVNDNALNSILINKILKILQNSDDFYVYKTMKMTMFQIQ